MVARHLLGNPPGTRRFFEGGFAGFLSEAPPAPPTRRAPPFLPEEMGRKKGRGAPPTLAPQYGGSWRRRAVRTGQRPTVHCRPLPWQLRDRRCRALGGTHRDYPASPESCCAVPAWPAGPPSVPCLRNTGADAAAFERRPRYGVRGRRRNVTCRTAPGGTSNRGAEAPLIGRFKGWVQGGGNRNPPPCWFSPAFAIKSGAPAGQAPAAGRASRDPPQGPGDTRETPRRRSELGALGRAGRSFTGLLHLARGC